MKKIEEAKLILQEIGMPKKQQTDLCGYTLLAMSSIGEDNDWSSSKNDWIKIHDII